MKKRGKSLLALLLAIVMILSSASISYAAPDEASQPGSEESAADEVSQTDPEESAEDEVSQPDSEESAEDEVSQTDSEESEEDESNELEMEELDPSTLGIKKLGEIEEKEEEIDISSEPMTSLNETVRVSIFLKAPATLDAGYSAQGVGTNGGAISYRNSLRANQAQVTAAIESTIGYSLNVKWNLTLLVNAISCYVKVKDIPIIERMDAVASVQRETRYEVPVEGSGAQPNTSNTSSAMVGATTAWSAGYTGAGTRIAIIDTGIDTDHQSFNADAFMYSIDSLDETPDLLTQSEVSALASQLNSKTGNYVSAKIPYGYNYVDGNTTINHVNDPESEHGSHVAGIAAANRYIRIGSSYVDAVTNVFTVGMAPDAQILVMKVFGTNGGAYDSDYMSAIEDAIVLGCDACNLSLGSGAQGFTYEDVNDYQDILNNLSSNKNPNMVVSISAGNSSSLTDQLYTDLYIDDVSMHTGGSPGTYINSLCVASADNIGGTGAPLVINGKDIYYTESSSPNGAAMTSVAGTWDFVYIDSIGDGKDYEAVNDELSLSGKVIIVNRGEINFTAKGNNLISYSPKALIVANNQRGNISMQLDAYTGTFPMVSITLKDAKTIKANASEQTIGGYTCYTGSVNVTSVLMTSLTTARENADISVFSSWGVPGSLIMKPEITAPGGSIYSVNGYHQTTSGGYAGGSDQYELMSGTSMAAPHMAGLSAVVGQYLEEEGIAVGNYSRRALTQSLLMSTATPMKDGGSYVSILQQGAGLVDVSKAVSASSAIIMTSAGLTSSTGAAADGKVKVELGDDPAKGGAYSYSFKIYNLTNNTLTFEAPRTDIFTQGSYIGADGFAYMSEGTIPAGSQTRCDWIAYAGAVPYDVDMNGSTSDQDAQAILDYLTGVRDENEVDLTVADVDEDGTVTTHDAHALLEYLENNQETSGYYIPANGCADVTIYFSFSVDSNVYTSGAYIEGFTYIIEKSSKDGAEGVQHTIPILGYFGSWTDPSMFDNISYPEVMYDALNGESYKVPYTGNYETNYMTVYYSGKNSVFFGNPYDYDCLEGEFPTERLAISSKDDIGVIYYNLYRAAGMTGLAVSKLDEIGGNITEVLYAQPSSVNVTGIWYYSNGQSWQNTGTKNFSVKRSAADFGLAEGDVFRIGYYAIPEYNCMMLSSDLTNLEAGMITTSAGFEKALKGEGKALGKGAFIGYDLTVDNTAPEILSVVLDGDELTITASDNENIAYLAIVSLDGEVIYADAIPAEGEYEVTFDASEAIENAEGYVAIFAGDYACNETAVAVQVNDNVTADPYAISEIIIDPSSLDIYKGNTVDLHADVIPITVEDRAIIWTSSDDSVATVDNNGTVTAVAAGTAVITAKASADESITAECTVKVTSINKVMNAIIWDEEGGVYFSDFNTNSLPTWNKKHNDPKKLPLVSAFMKDSSTLYAATFDTSSQSTEVYTVNRTNYELTDYCANYLFATDMALGASYYSDYVGLAYTYAYFLCAGNIESESYGGAEYVGLPQAADNFSATIGSDVWFAGIALKEQSPYGGTYYVLDENGIIWETTLDLNSDYTGFEFSPLELVLETGISTSFLYQNLYYDGEYLYWSHTDDSNFALLYIIDPESGAIYNAGNFGEAVWPAAGLYVNGSVAPASVGDSAAVNVDLSRLQPHATRDQLMTPDIQARFAAEAARFATKVVTPAVAPEEEPTEPAEEEPEEPTEPAEEETEEPTEPAEEEPEEPTEPAEEEPEEPTEPAEEEPEEPTEPAEEPVEEPTEPEEPAVPEEPTEPADDVTEPGDDASEPEPGSEEETDPEYTGSLNAVSGTYGTKHPVRNAASLVDEEPKEKDDTVQVRIYEEVVSHNGLYTVSYDPAALTYINTESTAAYKSVYADAENGIITFDFAATEAQSFEANADIAVVNFTLNTCAGTTVTVATKERNDRLGLTEEDVLTIESSASNIIGNTVNFDGKLSIRTYINLSEEAAADEDAYVLVTFDGKTKETTKHSVSELLKNGQIVVEQEVFAAMMRDEMTLQLFSGQDEAMPLTYKKTTDVTEGFTYNVITYLKDRQKNSTDPKMVELARTAELYGIAAQVYFNYKTDQLTEDDLAMLEEAVAETEIPDTYEELLTGSLPGGITDRKWTVTFESDNSLRMYFFFADADLDKYTFTVNNKPVEAVKASEGKYYIEQPNVASGLLSTVYTFSVTDGTDTYTINASALSYAYNRQEKSTNEAMISLCKMLYIYSLAANDFFGIGN